jgi:hypothetical protein
MSTAYKDIFPEFSGPGKMSDWDWARFGLEEAAMDSGDYSSAFPAHDKLAAIMEEEEDADG